MDGPTQEPLAAASGRRRDLLERGMLILVLLCCGVALSKNYADPDLWGHVTYGRDLLRHGLPATTTYSYTAEGHRWINHENLSEILLALGSDILGPRGLLLLKFGLGLIILGWMLRHARRTGVHRPLDFVVVLLVAANLMHFWSMRPQVFSYFLFALQMVLLNRCFAEGSEGRQSRWLWLAVPLMLVWANTHGAFVAGYAILCVYLAGRSLEAWWRDGHQAWPRIGQNLAVAMLSGLATLLNPYGIELHRWLIQSLGSPRPEIIEWRAPELFSVVWLPLWVMVGAFVASVLLSKRPRDLTQLALLVLTLWQAVEHRRHIPFFAILFGFWVAPHLASAWQRFRRLHPAPQAESNSPPGVRWAIALVVCLAGLLVSTSLLQQLSTIPVKRNDYPVSAFEFMARRQLRGNLVVRFKWAQYAIAAFASQHPQPRLRVAFDGRFRTCYPQEIVDMYFDFALGNHPSEPRHRGPDSPPVDGFRLLRDAPTDLVLIDRQQPNTVQVMDALRGPWVLLYQDQLAQLWGRSDRFDNPQSPDFLPPEWRQITEDPQVGYAQWPALPQAVEATQLSRRAVTAAGQDS